MTRPTPSEFLADANADGNVGPSDIPGWLGWLTDFVSWVFFWPGDTLLVVILVEAPGIAERYAMSTRWYSGWFTGVLSAVVWLVVIGAAVLWLRRGRPDLDDSGQGSQ